MLNDYWNLLERVRQARADDPKMADVPGGPTGFWFTKFVMKL